MNESVESVESIESVESVESVESAESVKKISGLYPLDWRTMEIPIGKGKFTHIFRRPTTAEVIEFDRDLQYEIPIGKDGSYSTPDPTTNDEANCRFYDLIFLNRSGYDAEPPTAHKSAAITAFYYREIEVEEGADAFAEQLTVIEEIGRGSEPDFTIRHTFRAPREEDVRKFRRRSVDGEVRPGKRGRQIYVTRSTLTAIAELYDRLIVKIDGATVDGLTWADENKNRFIDLVDPRIKQSAARSLFNFINESLLD